MLSACSSPEVRGSRLPTWDRLRSFGRGRRLPFVAGSKTLGQIVVRAIGFPATRSLRLTPSDASSTPLRQAASVFAASAGFAPGLAVPAVQGIRPRTFLAGPSMFRHGFSSPDSTNRAPLMRSCSLQRSLAAPCRAKLPAPHDPAAAFFSPGHPRPGPFARAVFWPARPVLMHCSKDAARAGHSRLITFQFAFQTRHRAISQPGRDISLPATLMGFLSLRRFAPASGCRRLSTLRGPPAVSPCAPPRLFLSRNPANSSPDQGYAWPRLLGFGPGHQPCLADRRPRYSFCAQGRATALTDPAMGFYPLPGLWRTAPVLLPEPIRSWASRNRPVRVCRTATGRIACPSASYEPRHAYPFQRCSHWTGTPA